MNVYALDLINSAFESTSVFPIGVSLFVLWRSKNDEAVSLSATVWWFVYVGWESAYLILLDQPLSGLANAVMCAMYLAMVGILIRRRKTAR